MPTYNVHLSDNQRQKLNKKANEEKCKISDIVKEGIELRMEFDPWFWGEIQKMSENLSLSPALIIENTIVKDLARNAAEKEIHGEEQHERVLYEYTFTDKGPISGKNLFSKLKVMYTHEIRMAALKEKNLTMPNLRWDYLDVQFKEDQTEDNGRE